MKVKPIVVKFNIDTHFLECSVRGLNPQRILPPQHSSVTLGYAEFIPKCEEM